MSPTQKTTPQSTPSLTSNKITSLPSFAERGAAIGKKLETVKADPRYKKLSPENQVKVREGLYKKYVPASYAGFHLPVPDEKTWVESSGRETAYGGVGEKLSESYGEGRTMQAAEDFGIGANKAFNNMTMFGAHIANKAFSAAFGLDQYHSHKDDKYLREAPTAAGMANRVQRNIQNLEDASRSKVQSDDFWLQTHPRDTVIGRLAGDAGELVATLPLYEALGAEGITEKVAAPLTARLATTPVGKYVAKRLIGATGTYLATLGATGGNQQQATVAAVAGEFFTAGVERIASAPLIKKWTANTIAMGGKPFAQDVVQSSFTEEEHAISVAEGAKEHPSAALQVQRAASDPVMHDLHTAEKVSLNSIARTLYGKPLRGISQKQRLNVLAHRLGQVEEAAREAPALLPDLTKAEEEHSIEAERQANPELHALMSQDEQMFGARFADVSTENVVTGVQKETGISNAPSAAKKVQRVSRESKGEDISPSGFASLNASSVNYLRAPRDRSEVDFINSRSSDAYDKTYQLLKKADGGFFKAEKPIQRFLYHYANKAKLPPGIRQSVLHWIKQTPEFQGKTEAEIFQSAKQMHVHMYDMAKSGTLKREGNVYASTKFSGIPKGTKWQKMLSDESDQAAVAGAQKALARHPEALKGFNATVKALQKKAFKSNNPEDIQAFKDELDKAARAIKTHASRGTAKIGGE